MPNFTITPPRTDQPLTTFDLTLSLLSLTHITPPRTDQPLTTFDPTLTLLPMYHITPPRTDVPLVTPDARVFSINEPDQILKNEVRRVTDL